ncbi:hypothetical protein BDV93DRAFT_461709, partial [Ceratobasidium sp. AG-I]
MPVAPTPQAPAASTFARFNPAPTPPRTPQVAFAPPSTPNRFAATRQAPPHVSQPQVAGPAPQTPVPTRALTPALRDPPPALVAENTPEEKAPEPGPPMEPKPERATVPGEPVPIVPPTP